MGNNYVPKGKMDLCCSSGNNHVLEGTRFKLPRGTTMFWGKKLLLGDMIIP
jgi:hypothetical protein